MIGVGEEIGEGGEGEDEGGEGEGDGVESDGVEGDGVEGDGCEGAVSKLPDPGGKVKDMQTAFGIDQ